MLRQLTRGTGTLFIVNDRPDIAVLSDADGVHVGQDELTVADCRTLVGSIKLVGVSTHSLAQARQAVSGRRGLHRLRPHLPFADESVRGFSRPGVSPAVQAEISIPAFAIGGINGENIARVLETGFRRVAVSGAVTAATDPAAAARSLCQAVRGPNLFTA